MKKLLTLLFALSLMFMMTACVSQKDIDKHTAELELKVVELNEVIQRMIIESEFNEIERMDELKEELISAYEVSPITMEKEVEVIPDGYVDSYFYCHEQEVYALVEELYDIIGLMLEDPDEMYYNNGQPILVYEAEGYDGYPTFTMYNRDGTVDMRYDIWDNMVDYCSFEPYDGYYD